MKRLVLLFLGLSLVSGVAADHPFYAFQNGVRLATDEARADLLAELGYDGIGSARLPGNGDLETLFATYRERGLKVFSFYTGAKLGEGGATVPEELMGAIPAMKGSGVVIEFFIQGSKNLPRQHAVDVVRRVADAAAESDVRLVLYPHTGFHIETFGEAVELARAVDRDNVGVMFNLCHFLRVEPESDLRETLRAAGLLLRQVSVSGAEKGGRDWKALIQPLGRGSHDVAELLAILDEIGFVGPVGLQCFNVEGKSEDFLAESIAAWRAMQ